jgi:6-pyruvoyltetrahydropterin/6-carboxytetrahydropterin synthase
MLKRPRGGCEEAPTLRVITSDTPSGFRWLPSIDVCVYSTTVSTDFVAQHYLTVPDPGPEGEPHSHHYEVELAFRGPELNQYDYLVDIDDVEEALGVLAARYRDTMLNDLPEFEGYNPSVERFARVIFERVTGLVTDETVTELGVTVWEDDAAAAAYDAAV